MEPIDGTTITLVSKAVVNIWRPSGTVQYSTVQYSTVQYSTVQYSTVQYSTVQYSTVQYLLLLSGFNQT